MIKVKEKPKLDPERVKEIDATRRVWHNRMVVLIPRYAVLHPEFIKQRGVPYSTSMSEPDRVIWNKEMVKVRMSINRQIMLFSEGVPIAYPNRIKAVEAYLDVKQHVANWRILLKGSLNTRTKAPPMEDFDLMLEFAENLEQYLEYYWDKMTAETFTPFKRKTMNRFISNDNYIHAPNSTYNNIREGLYGAHTGRIERVDDQRTTVYVPEGHLQPVIDFDEGEAFDAMAAIRG